MSERANFRQPPQILTDKQKMEGRMAFLALLDSAFIGEDEATEVNARNAELERTIWLKGKASAPDITRFRWLVLDGVETSTLSVDDAHHALSNICQYTMMPDAVYRMDMDVADPNDFGNEFPVGPEEIGRLALMRPDMEATEPPR